MRKIFQIMVLLVLLLNLPDPVAFASGPAGSGEKISAELQAALDAGQPDDLHSVVVSLAAQADLSKIGGPNRRANLTALIRTLQATAAAAQKPVIAWLQARQGSVTAFTPLWVFDGLSVTATAATIEDLARLPEVQSITPDAIDIAISGKGSSVQAEQNLSVIHAPALWNLGFYGQGKVIASMDSGVDISHPDLTGQWRGGTNSWYDPYGQHPVTPVDFSGHGTWTMGVMVGGSAGGTAIGVAPQAKWIAVKIFNDQGSATATAIHQGFQWLLDPDGNPNSMDAPDVVNNSWAISGPGCDLQFQLDLQALRAGGILPVFAAGNFGPGSSTSSSPANNPEGFAVGATDNLDNLYAYSSRGPSACGESELVYPEVVAPGVNIHTTDLFGFYTDASGTSLAAPQVAGGLALLLSAYPGLSADTQQSALTISAADLGAPGPDNDYGYGRIDLLAAYNWLASAPAPTPTPLPTATPAPTATAAPTATPVPTTLHIGDLDGTSSAAGNKWNATVTILLHDGSEHPLANAVVSGKWINGGTGSASCTTNARGLCAVTKTGLNAKTASISFSVTGASAAGLTYTPSANHDPDGDSNGTSIIVKK